MEPSKSHTLEALRSRMAEILAPGALAPAPTLADPGLTTLPFALRELGGGQLHQRLERLPRSHRVGRLVTEAARDSRAEMLALLALDPTLASAEPARFLFVDTETTGLGTGAGVLPFLVGLGWFDADGTLVLEQLLLKSPSEERAMLDHLEQRFSHASAVVSFNGKSFDLPLLASRRVMNHQRALPALPHLDLLHVARRLHKRRLGGCRLGQIESHVIGFERSGDIEGSEVAARYTHFLRTGDERALEQVVEHNAWDVVSMVALVGLYGEPLSGLAAEDLVELARTLRRGRALERAAEVADRAVALGAGVEALRVRAELAKARGDRAWALRDFEALAQEVDEPAVRLELAKLYEHWVKVPEAALAVLARGTGEGQAAEARRRARLTRKAVGPRGR